MACEMFVLGNRDLRLPGLGSYLQTAANAGDTRAILWGLARHDRGDRADGPVDLASGHRLEREVQVRAGGGFADAALADSRSACAVRELCRAVAARVRGARARSADAALRPAAHGAAARTTPAMLPGSGSARALAVAGAAWDCSTRRCKMVVMLGDALAAGSARHLLGAGATFLRVEFTLRAGRAVDHSGRRVSSDCGRGSPPSRSRSRRSPLRCRRPRLFPIVLLVLIRVGGGLGIGSIVLLLLGTQWYILFNVIAGASAIPTDLKEVCDVFHLSNVERWRKLLLPAIFPYLITGFVTASGRRLEREHRGGVFPLPRPDHSRPPAWAR